MTRITDVEIHDLRFPTSKTADGSDAMNQDADYSAAYVVLVTDEQVQGGTLRGHGFTFTIGRGNELCAQAAGLYAERLIGLDLDSVVDDLGGVYRMLTSDSQLRWLGPEKGVVHLALAAVMNAAWDLAARRAGKPLWRYLAELDSKTLVDALDLRYLSDELTRDQALAMLRASEPLRAARIAELDAAGGYPCYTTSAGWLGYDDDKMVRLLREAVDEGYRHVKLKVGRDLAEDRRRVALARQTVGPDIKLMIDANQMWDVPEAIDWVRELQEYDLHWIEEPTSPDDVLGHAAIRRGVAPTGVATGEHGMNRVLFKQLLQAEAIDFCQIDSARLASINEILPVYLMAAGRGIPVCPHAGGVGLCELVQHLSIFDYVAITGTTEDRITEYVDHLHEHFTDPCIVESARYRMPQLPGYSAQIFADSIATYRFPEGTYWVADAS
ncbi:fuconate dehydratase [Microbacterium sp. Root166]|uniref:enolase C-terminal domain-like protein n=1 Tax=Microbacterium sp. Root166 TaxID=1736478 RepID=UPI0006F8A381|nr:enolase C-terminal domain-like protein [Microbacterium sp. Root166]KQZ85154.1 fuconate dehydratase [Microbacterium sp. Root166]